MRFHCLLLLAVCVAALALPEQVPAQAKPAGAEKSPLCTRDNALEMIRQQVDLTRTYNNSIKRITVLIRAADLWWPHQQAKARAAFTEAFELAIDDEKKSDHSKSPRSVFLRLQVPDQRYVVIRAVAKKDPAFARELTAKILKSDDDEASSKRDEVEDSITAERLLDSATKLISTDFNAAFDLARASLKYPATASLTRFLYRVAEVNQSAADEFYVQALAAYDDKPFREFLYLQAYPFAWHETLNTPVFAFYQPPANFAPNKSVQRRYVEVLLRRAQQALETPADESDSFRSANIELLPGTVHLVEGLLRLEPEVRESLPDLAEPLVQAREKLLVTFSPETQKLVQQPGRDVSNTAEPTFAEQVEAAEKLPDVNDREEQIATAVFRVASEKESVATVIQVIDKISYSELRKLLTEWFYFQRAAAAIKDKQFEEAEGLAAKVEGHEQRAFLLNELAKGLLTKSDLQTHGREVLDEAITEAMKAGNTIFAARALLTASNLYTKIDLSRAISLLADAINCINRLEAPDFVSDDQATQVNLVRKGKPGQYRGEYIFRYYMPGLTPEAAFRELAKLDFDTAIAQSNALTDKFQRALASLALADVCLQQTQRRNPKTEKRARP
jgi:hypothetical protein